MNYRKIWESVNGPIPKDEESRSYEIHHIDGNRKNNSIENLMCVSIQEHYNMHYNQGDWAAASIIGKRMKKDFRGWKHSKSTIEKIRQSNLGKPGTNLGRVWSEEINEKRRQTLLSKNKPKEPKKVSGECKYCSVFYAKLKAHDKSCKSNPNRIYKPISKDAIEKRQRTRYEGVGYSTIKPIFREGNIPWNKGLTKELNETVAKIANSKIGKKRPPVTETTREKLRAALIRIWNERRLNKTLN